MTIPKRANRATMVSRVELLISWVYALFLMIICNSFFNEKTVYPVVSGPFSERLPYFLIFRVKIGNSRYLAVKTLKDPETADFF